MTHSLFVLASALCVAACGRGEDTVALKPASAAACEPSAYFLELPTNGGFVLNSEMRDSTSLIPWLTHVLPRRDSAGRIVNVRAAASRTQDLRWLIPAIQRAGGSAYSADSACHISIPALVPSL